jgi:hypothetical protein
MTRPRVPAAGAPDPRHRSPVGRARVRAVFGRRWVRRLVLRAGLGALALAEGVAVLGGWWWTRAAIETTGTHDFVNPLAIPPPPPRCRCHPGSEPSSSSGSSSASARCSGARHPALA